jgi:hypothetical protein
MPDPGFGRCDGHHEMVDLRLRKNAAACAISSHERVRLYSRPGNNLSRRCPLIVETLARLRSR